MSEQPKLARPRPDEIMAQLKDFQRATVDEVFERMYLASPSARRYLVADEVGLGKTLVAKGLIARAVDHLWDSVDRIDVIYICSNTDIARQNIQRLNLQADAKITLASRLTLLPTSLPDIRCNKLNFVAFTPGTSFNLRSTQGVSSERVLLYRMLREPWELGNRKGPKRVLQGGVRTFKRFNDQIRWATAPIDPTIHAAFIAALVREERRSAERGEPSLRERFAALAKQLTFRDAWALADEDWNARTRLVGALRALLAQVCLNALEPDIIVLDEFQRFRNLLQGDDEMSELARELFDYRDPDGKATARVLLLSATPYKMYTRHHEQEDDHYQDFIATMRFLLGDDERATTDFEQRLAAYRKALYRLSPETVGELRAAKRAVEETLRTVMVRNERMQAGRSHNAMLSEKPMPRLRLEPSDLAAYLGVHRLAEAIDARDHVEYWKSGAFLPNFMDKYVLGRQLDDALLQPDGPARVAEALRDHPEALLRWADIEAYQPIDSANPKLRALAEQAVDSGAWRLLWLPPSLPYYAPGGVFAGPSAAGVTKTLIFSAWKMVPKVIATLLSYDVERRMIGEEAERYRYDELTRQRRPLLRFAGTDRTLRDGRSVRDLSGMTVLPLLYPCITLAETIDPLVIGAELRAAGKPPTVEAVLDIATAMAEALLAPIVPAETYQRPGNEDRAWYWSALAQLEGRHNRAAAEAWLRETDGTDEAWSSMLRKRDEDGAIFLEHQERFRAHLAADTALDRADLDLGRAPADLPRAIALIALASPAVCALRALLRQGEAGEAPPWSVLLPAAAGAAMGFRSLFNLPESITLLRALSLAEDDEDDSYWGLVLRYGLDGNLQALLDEYVHVLRSSLGLLATPLAEAAGPIGEEIQRTAALRSNLLHFDELDCAALDAESMRQRHRLRCRYAMGFGLEAEDTEGERSRDDRVRGAFNSPFRPFVLATTSIGQEGLDFHWYCHRVVHWNLPGNPVDLEQREGRVNRYKGHAIRRNVALQHGEALFNGAGDGASSVATKGDAWQALFERAYTRDGRAPDASDLDPFWIYEDGGHRVERYVPSLPLSREREFLPRLKQSLVAYRLVFGQPRQEDLVDFLTRTAGLDERFLGEVLRECRIDLSGGQRSKSQEGA